MADLPRFIVYAFGAGIWGVEDTSAQVDNGDGTTSHKVAAFDGPRASVQVAALLNAAALPDTALVWETAVLPTPTTPSDPPVIPNTEGQIQ